MADTQSNRCVGTGCTLRFRDQGKSKGYNVKVLTSPFSWLIELLKYDRVNTAEFTNFVPSICYKCYKKYERKRAGDVKSAVVEDQGDDGDCSLNVGSSAGKEAADGNKEVAGEMHNDAIYTDTENLD